MKKSVIIPLLIVSAAYVFTSINVYAQVSVVDRDGRVIEEIYSSEDRVDRQHGRAVSQKEIDRRAKSLLDGTGSRDSMDPKRNRRVLPDGSFVAIDSAKPVEPFVPNHRASEYTIDTTTLNSRSGNYSPYLPIVITGTADEHTLDNGEVWDSGAGGYTSGQVQYSHTEVDGTTVRYYFTATNPSEFIGMTDYNGGDHSANGTLGFEDELVLTATIGESEAYIEHGLTLLTNQPANYNDDRFYYFSAVVDSVVPFTVQVTHTSGTWQSDTFDGGFSYLAHSGLINFADPISSPQITSVQVVGASQLPPDSTIAMSALAEYSNSALYEVSSDATWSLQPEGLATISAEGVIQTGSAPQSDTVLSATAEYEGFTASLELILIGEDTLSTPDLAWATFQGSTNHTGQVQSSADPEDFDFRWQVQVSSSNLHQVAAADGKVFVSIEVYFNDVPQLFALDAIDGQVLWEKGFGGVNSVNPPAYAYGNVYLQTGKPSGGTPYLHGIDANTGETIFSSPYSNQWSSHLAPTISDSGVYINGGYYGGMYRYNAFSGEQDWFIDLAQYDDWTPSLGAERAYGYAGGYFYAVDRATGELIYTLSDTNFDWNGYSMRGALALVGDHSAVTVHNQRLIKFDLINPGIDWDLLAGFRGQPAVDDTTVYASASTTVSALALSDGSEIWSWSAPASESLKGQVIANQSHVFVSGDSTTYVLSIGTGEQVWSYPAGGELAIGEENLYIAGGNGVLTAISMPEVLDVPPVSIELIGPDTLAENESANYGATVTYADGRVRDRTFQSAWFIKPNPSASISDSGTLSVGELLQPTVSLTIGAVFSSAGVELTVIKSIEVSTSLSNQDFALRNLDNARIVKESVIEQLNDAKRFEQSAESALKGQADPASQAALPIVVGAGESHEEATQKLEDALEKVNTSIDILDGSVLIRQ